jgi:hypothetical protein
MTNCAIQEQAQLASNSYLQYRAEKRSYRPAQNFILREGSAAPRRQWWSTSRVWKTTLQLVKTSVRERLDIPPCGV